MTRHFKLNSSVNGVAAILVLLWCGILQEVSLTLLETEDEELSSNQVPQGPLKYVWGDALSNPEALGPDGDPYPWEAASKIAGKQRAPRSLMGDASESKLLSPEETRQLLLKSFQQQSLWEGGNQDGSYLIRNGPPGQNRKGRSNKISSGTSQQESANKGGCVPAKLCESSYNTTAPMYGISLTSGQPVTIVQKFPDLLQQVVYQVCKTEECDVIQGQCVQTYLPYLFLVIPLGPVTLTGQDYILLESGCECRPKYAKKTDDPPPFPFIQSYNQSKPRANKRF